MTYIPRRLRNPQPHRREQCGATEDFYDHCCTRPKNHTGWHQDWRGKPEYLYAEWRGGRIVMLPTDPPQYKAIPLEPPMTETIRKP